jgi:hypothetical protein
MKKGLADILALGGRLTGKTSISLIIDTLISIFNKVFTWGVISSCDLNHLIGVMDDIVFSLSNHPIMRLFKGSIVKAPSYKIHCKNGIKLESVNNTLSGKEVGGNWYQKHPNRILTEEASFLTAEVTSKRLMAVSELGAVFRDSGMTTMSKNSPMGKAFYDIRNKSKIVNLPSYANPTYNRKKDDDAITEFNGKNSQGYLVQIVGKIVEHGDSVYDMDRIRATYRYDKKSNPILIKKIEISKENYHNYKDLIIIDKPRNAQQTWVSLDKGEGAAPTEIIVLFIINGIYNYKYNITLFKLKPDEDEEIINYIIEKLEANIIPIDATSGTGKSLVANLSKKYPKNVIAVNFNEKIKVDIERDEKGEYEYDKNGKPIYKYEKMVDWSIQQLKDIFYNNKIKCLYDFNLDKQFNGVIAMNTGKSILYKYKTENHLFQAFQCMAIAHWLLNFKYVEPIKNRRPGLGIIKYV